MMIRYLLGEVSEQEKIQLEETYFGDDEVFEEMLTIENELIDAYVRGELPASERELFEKKYLTSPERHRRVEFAKALLRVVSHAPAAIAPSGAGQERVSWWHYLLAFRRVQPAAMQLSLATVLLVVVLGGPWLILQNLRLQHQLEQTNAEQVALRQKEQELQRQLEGQRARIAQQSEETQREPNGSRQGSVTASSPQPQLSIASFILTPGLVRDINNEAKRLVVTPGTKFVRLQLDLEEDNYQSYRAVLRSAEGKDIWKQDSLKAQSTKSGKAVVLTLSSDLLTQGDYLIALSGVTAQGDIEDVAEYYLPVSKRKASQ